MRILQEFKTFAMRGSVIDLAVGVVIGAAFTAIVNSLANDIITPPLGVAMGGVDFKDYFLVLSGDGGLTTLQAARDAGAVTLNYGMFVNAIIQFLVIAAAMFILIRQINVLVGAKPPATGTPPAPAEDVVLLREIRDLLKTRA
jgi:large conductance mechanosensitive channel